MAASQLPSAPSAFPRLFSVSASGLFGSDASSTDRSRSSRASRHRPACSRLVPRLDHPAEFSGAMLMALVHAASAAS